ncbi:methylated-DNA--[protein]-cysteine S-methyltransferase [Helicobacter jaachi]|uniref:methylated-DNA--[protein]-cysteine S-methyltransferase n=1 Tax=Helicobacter jaachi TaxID=1677920 RepID=A0A4U8TCU6_9HELI|nr:methylated-DNA--[protein]-cysteine S-methyltransferase [Helicobacter jaachi]TLD97801.1 methylated-DNA--[protein]-cysteine S-methyltransferase [Helicobacter jaachi]
MQSNFGGIYKIIWEQKAHNVGIYGTKDYITRIVWNAKPTHLPHTKTPLSDECAKQLQAYFQKQLKNFDVPYLAQGSAFNESVWEHLARIPYGQTRTYKDIAHSIHNPRSARAVGNANRCNPLVILIPCHRVVRCGGVLGGYAYGMDMKLRLLALEGASI